MPFLSPVMEGEITIFLSVSTEGLDDTDETTDDGVSNLGLVSVKGFDNFEFTSEIVQKKNKSINSSSSVNTSIKWVGA